MLLGHLRSWSFNQHPPRQVDTRWMAHETRRDSSPEAALLPWKITLRVEAPADLRSIENGFRPSTTPPFYPPTTSASTRPGRWKIPRRLSSAEKSETKNSIPLSPLGSTHLDSLVESWLAGVSIQSSKTALSNTALHSTALRIRIQQVDNPTGPEHPSPFDKLQHQPALRRIPQSASPIEMVGMQTSRRLTGPVRISSRRNAVPQSCYPSPDDPAPPAFSIFTRSGKK